MSVEYETETNTHKIAQWDDLNICEDILRSIYNYGFETPSEIQRKAIPPILENKDVLAQAQSGTGKTGAFVIGALSKVDITNPNPQVLILAPTHELVNQIHTVVQNLSVFMTGLVSTTLVGGTSVSEEISRLKTEVPHVVVGCTGRVFDMIKRSALNTRYVKICVLDEADEMLSIGFKDQIYNIFQMIPSNVQVALFSATMPEPIIAIADRFMRDPTRIMMAPEELNLEGIRQFYVAMYNDHTKYERLKDLFQSLTMSQTIIYANNVLRVVDLYNAMTEEGFSVCCIHSNMTKPERKDVITKFRSGNYRVLISSNITARGIDVQQVNTVINFDIPKSPETYLHRIGRSGRWGRKGVAINFVTKHDIFAMKTIEKHYKINIEELPENFVFQ
jgi:translation initiation factor 4A